jgi:hypothetical protein
MAGPADHPLKCVAVAFRTFDLGFLIRTDKKLLEKVPAFKTSEFKYGHLYIFSIASSWPMIKLMLNDQ